MTVCLSPPIPIYRLTILSPLAIAGGLYFFFLGWHLLAGKRRLLATPTVKIGSATQGGIEVNGEAAGPYTLSAPITGKPCFLYRTTAWQPRGDNNAEWQKNAEETLHLPFFVADATGKLLIEPLGADLDLLTDFSAEYDAAALSSNFLPANPDELPPRVSVFLSRHGIVPSRRLRVEERSIKPGDALFVTGTIAENPGVQVRPVWRRGSAPSKPGEAPLPHSSSAHNSSERVAVQEIINLSNDAAPPSIREMSQQAKIAAALNRAGITKPEAWSAAGLPYQNVAVEENAAPTPLLAASEQHRGNGHRTESDPDETRSKPDQDSDLDEASANSRAFDLTPPVVMMKGEDNQPFAISFRSQKEFASALAWKSTALMWGGTAITLLGLYTMLRQMRIL